MIVTGFDTSFFRLPPARRWEDATHVASELEYLVLRLQTRTGEEGFGFAYSVGVGLSAVRNLLEDYCRPLVTGQEIFDTERIWDRLWNNLHRVGSGGVNTMAIAAIDIAVWDLVAKAHGLPLYRVLGGARDRIRAYHSGIDMSLTPAELADQVAAAVGQGYQAVKVKVGAPTVRADVARLSAVREVAGDDVAVFLDANQRWHLDEAVGRIRALEPFGPSWIEEPLIADDVASHAHLRQQVGIPLAVGESLYTRSEFLSFLRSGAVDVLQPDVVRVGGITEWMKIAHLAGAFGVRVSAHYVPELSVHLVCAVPNALMLEWVDGGGLTEIGLATGDPVVRGGLAFPPSAPGHGIGFDLPGASRRESGRNAARSQPGEIYKPE